MPINVSEALDSDTAILLTVIRPSGGYIDGVWTPGTSNSFKVLCSPQQPTPKELQNLPEGERDKSVYKFITNKPVRTVNDRDGTPADKIRFNGKDYKIISVSDWDVFGQTTSFGARVK